MRRLFLAAALAVATSVASFADIGRYIGSGSDEFGGYTSEHILVRFKAGQVPAGLRIGQARTGDPQFDRLGSRWRVGAIDTIQPGGYGNPGLADRLGLTRTYMLRVPTGTDVIEMIHQYNALPNVEFAELDGLGGAAFTPNDPNIANCYGLNNTGQTGGTVDADIDAFEAWDTFTGGANIILAVVDSGVSPHPDLNGKFVSGWNTNNNSSNTSDGLGHGTHVAGTAGASGNNGVGVAGVSFGVRIMPMRVLTSGGSGTEAQCGAGMVWAADHGANICTMSLQFYTGSQTFRDNVDYAFNQGVLLIAATGNNQGNVVAFPARFPNCYGVGATTDTDGIAGFSNFGPECDISAPGEDVYSLYLNNGYTTMSGTSMATPHTSGLASLIWSYDPGLTNTEVFKIITTTPDDKGPVGWDSRFGWGRINANRAILKAAEPICKFTSMNVDSGVPLGGGVNDLFHSDDVKVKVRGHASRTSQDVVITASGSAPLLSYNRLQVLLEASCSADGVTQRVELFDWTLGSWVTVDERIASTSDTYSRINVTSNPSRFLSPATNTCSARVTFDPPSLSFRLWSAEVDQFRAALRTD